MTALQNLKSHHQNQHKNHLMILESSKDNCETFKNTNLKTKLDSLDRKETVLFTKMSTVDQQKC